MYVYIYSWNEEKYAFDGKSDRDPIMVRFAIVYLRTEIKRTRNGRLFYETSGPAIASVSGCYRKH